ncbi:MAG: hypothetical protein WC553_01900 [Patescibacteria group bacterium]|jgi:hypothetical protein
MANAHGLIRTIYLYLFALVGLFFFIFGVVNGIGATMNRYVWPQQFVQYDYNRMSSDIEGSDKSVTALTLEQQKEQFTIQQDNEFRRRATESIPAVVIGWLLWWFHWNWIKRDSLSRGHE